MSHLNKKRTMFASLIALGTIVAIPVVAQQFEVPKQVIASVPGAPLPLPGQGFGSYPSSQPPGAPGAIFVTGQPLSPEEIQKLSERRLSLMSAIAKWKSTESSVTDKKEARDSIANYLNEEFERDQKNRKNQIQQLEEQVAKLRKQVEKRADAQSKIIELRMQLLENDSEGLAFPDGFHDLQNPNISAHPGAFTMGTNIPFIPPYPTAGYPSGPFPSIPGYTAYNAPGGQWFPKNAAAPTLPAQPPTATFTTPARP